LLNLLPFPNVPGAVGPAPNYAVTGVNNYDTDQFDVRVDHYLTSSLNYFGRFSYTNVYLRSPGAFGLYGGPQLSPQGVNISEGLNNDLVESGVIGLNYVFSPTLLTDFRFAATRYRIIGNPLDINQPLATQAGIPGLNIPGHPDTFGLPDLAINGTGAFTMGYQCNCPLHETENLFQWISNWTKVKGNHTLKWGVELQRAQNLRLPSDNHRAGVYQFQPSVTSSATDPSAGSGLASFLLGDPSSFDRFAQISTNQQDRQTRMFYYAQNTWRVTHKLTLNYGLRWDTWFPDTSLHAGQGGRYDVGNNFVWIPGIGGITLSADAQTQWHNFSPRLAVAYAVDPKTVVRAGWGRSYNQGTFGWTFNNLAADVYPSIVNQSLPAISPFFPVQFVSGAPLASPSLGTAPPAVVFPTIPSSGLLPLANGIGVSYIPVNQKIPYVDSWNFTAEREVTNSITVSLGYVANTGRHLNMGYNLNAAIPGPGSDLNLRRPLFLQYGLTQGIFDKCDCESSNYHSLQAQAVKRFSNNLSFIANYTWQKAMDFGEFGTPTDQYNTLLDYGPASFNRSNVFTLGHVYNLPFGKGQHWFSDVHGVWDKLISAWEWTGFTTVESGMPFSATLSSNASLNSDMSLRPDRIGNPLSGTPHDRNQWFNPSAFATPGPFLFGTAARNALTGPPLFSADWGLFKNFQLTERFELEFRWEVYNTFNYTNLGQLNGVLNTNTDTATAGQITDVGAPMRNMQFGLHLRW
jgi:TonB dependent receptor-like, beta-barrel